MGIGQSMYDLCAKMFPICRSITGNGVRQTLDILQQIYPDMKRYVKIKSIKFVVVN